MVKGPQRGTEPSRRLQYLLLLSVVALAHGAGCGGDEPTGELQQRAISAICTARVLVGGGAERQLPMEEYIYHVVTCEHGQAPLEALKAQAVAARSFAYYVMTVEKRALKDGQSDQVYSCAGRDYPNHPRSALIKQAVDATVGEVLSVGGDILCAFYVNGSVPTTSSCIPSPKAGLDSKATFDNTSGAPSSLGWSKSPNNHGCMSQNSATCLDSKRGYGYEAILAFFYGPTTMSGHGNCASTTPTTCDPQAADACSGTSQYCKTTSCVTCASGFNCDGIGSNGCECPEGCEGTSCATKPPPEQCQPSQAFACGTGNYYCNGGRCTACPSGGYNCDGTYHCECTSPCDGQSCGAPSECDTSTPRSCPSTDEFCSAGKCTACPAGSFNCDGTFHCECTTACDGTSCTTTQGCSESTVGSCGGQSSYCNGGRCEICPTGMKNCDGTFQCECTGDCTGQQCAGPPQPTCAPQPEVCNGRDDNCNGLIDDGNPGGGALCLTGAKGACAQGVSVCQQGRIFCQQTVFPTQELCDGIDNDCNGVIDDAVDCSHNCRGTTEECNGIDDNCDGRIDEDNPQGGQVCFAGDECPVGVTECTANGLICRPVAQTEICDGLDNDCNGVVDDVPGGCDNHPQTCIPQPELCNGLDDDCDGFPDEDDPQGGSPCSRSDATGIYSGQMACIDGQLVCWAFKHPTDTLNDQRRVGGSSCSLNDEGPAQSWPWTLALLALALLRRKRA